MLTSTVVCASFPCWRCCWNHKHTLREIIFISQSGLLCTHSDYGNTCALSTWYFRAPEKHCTFLTTVHGQWWMVFNGYPIFLYIRQPHPTSFRGAEQNKASVAPELTSGQITLLIFIHLRLNWMVDSIMDWSLLKASRPFRRQEIGMGRLTNGIWEAYVAETAEDEMNCFWMCWVSQVW